MSQRLGHLPKQTTRLPPPRSASVVESICFQVRSSVGEHYDSIYLRDFECIFMFRKLKRLHSRCRQSHQDEHSRSPFLHYIRPKGEATLPGIGLLRRTSSKV